VKINWAEKLRQNVHGLAESLGNLFVETFHYLALFAIGAVDRLGGGDGISGDAGERAHQDR